MSRTVNVILAALVSIAVLGAAIGLARYGGDERPAGRKICAEHLCGVVFF